MNDPTTANSSRPAGVFLVAGWSVDGFSHHISKDGKTTKLEPRTMELLLYLASRPGETISREELEREVWPGQVVVYEALSNSIAKLRKAFGDDSYEPRIIETIPKGGYRLIAEVSDWPAENSVRASEESLSERARSPTQRPLWVGTAVFVAVVIGAALIWMVARQSQDEPADSQPAVTSPGGKPSIAVLPFTNLSGDQDQEYFADGMTDDLITRLSKVSGLLVIARNSTFKYKGESVDISRVSRELGVRYVLEGSVRRDGERARINAQLIDVETGGHLWADLYDGSMTDIFATQDHVTQSVVAALKVHLTESEQAVQAKREPVDPVAYDAFLRARSHFYLHSPEDFVKAIPYLEKSIELEPDFAPAHAVLAGVYWQSWTTDWIDAIGISSDGAIKKVELHLDEALKNPTPLAYHISSRFLNSQGRNEESLLAAQRAVALDPNDAYGYTALARIYNRIGRPADALEAVKKGMRLDPEGDFRGALSHRLGESYFHLDRFEEAAAAFETSAERASADDEWDYVYLAAAYGHLGQMQKAQDALETFNRIRAKRGRRPYTLAHMDGWGFANESIRERFRDGLRKMGMPQGGASPPPDFRGLQQALNEVPGAKTIGAAEAKALLDRRVLFVSVVSDKSWNAGHISGSVHLPLYYDFTEAELSKLVAKDGEVVIFGSGPKSGRPTRAVATAVGMGFENVYFFREGFPGWKAAGYPIEVGSK